VSCTGIVTFTQQNVHFNNVSSLLIFMNTIVTLIYLRGSEVVPPEMLNNILI